MFGLITESDRLFERDQLNQNCYTKDHNTGWGSYNYSISLEIDARTLGPSERDTLRQSLRYEKSLIEMRAKLTVRFPDTWDPEVLGML